jgi:hypothetical protein
LSVSQPNPAPGEQLTVTISPDAKSEPDGTYRFGSSVYRVGHGGTDTSTMYSTEGKTDAAGGAVVQMTVPPAWSGDILQIDVSIWSSSPPTPGPGYHDPNRCSANLRIR